MAEYRAEMGPPPVDIDTLSSLTPAQRATAEKKAAEQTKKDYPPKPAAKTAPTKKAEPVKKYAKGGSVRGDGICQRGKTKGRFV